MISPKCGRKEEILKQDYDTCCRKNSDWSWAAQLMARDYVAELERILAEIRNKK